MSEKTKQKHRRLDNKPTKQSQTAARTRYLSSLAAGHAAKNDRQRTKGV